MDQVARTVLGLGLLAAVACLVPLVDGVRQARAVVWSAARGAVQLLAIGLLLGAVFRAPLAVLPVLAVMVVAATGTVAPRLAGLPARGRWRRPAAAAAASSSGAAVTGVVVFATGQRSPPPCRRCRAPRSPARALPHPQPRRHRRPPRRLDPIHTRQTPLDEPLNAAGDPIGGYDSEARRSVSCCSGFGA
jgi:Uncharacterised protein family (UPF0014)